jgi:hypothetical protein
MNINLAEIISDPKRAGDVQKDAIPLLMAQLVAVQSALLARFLTDPHSQSAQVPNNEKDILLTADQAAPLLNVTPNWLYRHARQLPFSRRLSRKVLRFSEAGIRRWQAIKKS